jgi:hypothetical protein
MARLPVKPTVSIDPPVSVDTWLKRPPPLVEPPPLPETLPVGTPASPMRVVRGPRSRVDEEGAHERPKKQLQEIALSNLGGTARAHPPTVPFVYMLRWRVVAQATGEEPTVSSIAEFWGESPRTVYRWQAAFRAAFPGEHDPKRILLACDRDSAAAGWRGLAEALVHVAIVGE